MGESPLESIAGMVRENADANSGARIALDRQRIPLPVFLNNLDVTAVPRSR
jgi:hypothetical protein